MQRPAGLDNFLAVLCAAMVRNAQDHAPARLLAEQMEQAVRRQPGTANRVQPCRLGACDHLETALARDDLVRGPVAALATAFADIAPSLRWYQRPAAASDAPGFHAGHANAQIIGPMGLERHDDVAVGASLLAPHVVYPLHSHPPREIYTILSDGDWFTEARGWTTPGVGGMVYHDADIVHAMRSGATPLLAIWCLWLGQ